MTNVQINALINAPINALTNALINALINAPINALTSALINAPINDRGIGQGMGQGIDQGIGRGIDQGIGGGGGRVEGGRTKFRLSRKQKVAMKRHVKSVSKRFLMFLVSHVGLTCLVVAYSIMGGFIFQALEASNEVKGITHIHQIRERHVLRLWNVTVELNILDPVQWQEKASKVLEAFQMEIYQAVKDKRWDGTDNVINEELQWTFAGSLLYSVTVITTIGYGHLTPKTMWGRVVTMVYALVGIPMTLLCLTNIGCFMANCFRLLWKQIVCQPCRNRLRRRSAALAARRKAAAAIYISSLTPLARRPAGEHSPPEYCPDSPRGHHPAKSPEGPPPDSTKDASELLVLTESLKERPDGEGGPVVEGGGDGGGGGWVEITAGGGQVDEPWEVDDRKKVVRVPIVVCLVMVAAYIVLGAVLFSLWERWNYFDSSYFCFITLSTIGFGDIVPGYEHNTWDNQAKRVSCTLYLLFGLALVAMCFDLIQTECREIFRDLAKAFGFTEDDSE
ncbi:potassium channel subfamily K member 18-like [Babylonia areolata]|uniref:potassium channel subfamily K member 18-like n=1 Tax=Babylonia areolata TaxID=304850 RepID=UPI003FD4D218